MLNMNGKGKRFNCLTFAILLFSPEMGTLSELKRTSSDGEHFEKNMQHA